MRTIGVVTVGRSDYGVYQPVLQALRARPEVEVRLFVAGMHLAPEFGLTVRDVEADGLPIQDRIEMLLASDSAEATAKAIGLGVIGFAQAYGRWRPDLLMVLGDRFEMYAAALAALPFGLPVAHVHGGELTEGAIDDALRHSMTKLSHLHFVATVEYGRRVRQLGEEPWRVMVSGAPSLDGIHEAARLSPAELEERFDVVLTPPPLLVTYHPVTLEQERTERQVEALLQALEVSGLPLVFTAPNADAAGRAVTAMVREFVACHAGARLVTNFGRQGYCSMMRHAAAMVGNSSSGLIEAASFGLPTVNVGSRQAGRVRGRNVIDAGDGWDAIAAAIARAVSPDFRASLVGLRNPYGDGGAGECIAAMLAQVPLGASLLRKRFCDLEGRVHGA